MVVSMMLIKQQEMSTATAWLNFLLPVQSAKPHTSEKVYFSSVTPHPRHTLLIHNRLGVTDG